MARIAKVNAFNDKNVMVLALEAKKHEFMQRIKYQRLAELFYERKLYEKFNFYLRYRDWLRGRWETELYELNKEVDSELYSKYQTLDIVHRESGKFTSNHLIDLIKNSYNECELLIIDHLHLFDFEGYNDNKEMKRLMMTLRDVTTLNNLPIVAVSHLRKQDRGDLAIMPSMDELHGSSDIGKIGYTVITMSSYKHKSDEVEEHIYPTLFRVAKDRTDGSVSKYLGLQKFNARTNCYEESVEIGKWEGNWTKEFNPIQDDNYPYWASSLKTAKNYGEKDLGRVYGDL
jgi:hypothetical protein